MWKDINYLGHFSVEKWLKMQYVSVFSKRISHKGFTHCGLVMSCDNSVNIGSSNGLLPGGTKPLPEPVLSYHQ